MDYDEPAYGTVRICNVPGCGLPANRVVSLHSTADGPAVAVESKCHIHQGEVVTFPTLAAAWGDVVGWELFDAAAPEE